MLSLNSHEGPMKYFLLCLFFFLSSELASANSSQITSLINCQLLPSDREVLVSLCDERDGYTVEYLWVDIRGWFVLKKGNVLISEQQMVSGNNPGFAPYVGETLEWRYDEHQKF